MNAEEANKIIAEYMNYDWDALYGYTENGVRLSGNSYSKNYFAQSLDALIPVWEKLERLPKFVKYKTGYQCLVDECLLGGKWWNGKTLPEAAAIATAKAIQELS